MDDDAEGAGMGAAPAGRVGGEGETGRQEGIAKESMTQLFKQHLRTIQADMKAIKAHGISKQDLENAVNLARGRFRTCLPGSLLWSRGMVH
eukprot:8983826-Pyramimonas_sp.AAC.1